ncbi:MAG: TraX family protein [Flavonifractor plautii]|nr:TraX family protein [Flavonifractor plautii]MDU6291463.1 TraX family protein [Flavonifractor plautii]MDU6343731.1 TraX family protein [Flavonifractor plautii]
MSSFSLKILATILMIIDHLAYFWYDFFPLWFRWLGCASAPIFIFCLVHSYDKTHSKAKLMIRLYLFSVCMAVINIILMCLGYIIAGDTVASIDLRSFNFFSTLFLISLIIRILETERIRRKVILLVCLAIWQIVCSIFLTYIAYMPLPWFEWSQSGILSLFVQLLSSITGNILWTEGSVLIVLFGVLLYYAKENKYSLILLLGGFSLFYFLYSLTDWNWYIINTVLEAADAFTGSENFRDLIERTFEIAQLASSGHGIESLFFTDYKWMMIEVLPIILTYNGKRGKPFKYAFYWFYPFHIYLIWGIRLLFD